MCTKNNRIVYWEFLYSEKVKKLNENQQIIGTLIAPPIDENDEYDVVLVIEEIIEEEKQ